MQLRALDTFLIQIATYAEVEPFVSPQHREQVVRFLAMPVCVEEIDDRAELRDDPDAVTSKIDKIKHVLVGQEVSAHFKLE